MSRERAQALLTESFGPFGKLNFPYVKMGNIDSLHLFGDTELMIFAIYWHNKDRWKNVLDIGANIGLHSICMAKLGWEVTAYEPDYQHYATLTDNIAKNDVSVQTHMAAVSTSGGVSRFVRVLNNLTGNHLEGYKNSYGPTETVLVNTVNCRALWSQADFAKIDCEGNEAELCKTMDGSVDAILEVRNGSNAREIYDHFNSIQVPMWSQKRDWRRVLNFDDMPMANREGSLFVGKEGPWR